MNSDPSTSVLRVREILQRK